MLYHLTLDTNKYNKPQLFDSRTRRTTTVQFEGARSFLEEYVNRMHLTPISIHESHLPDRSQLVCWYTLLTKGSRLYPSPEEAAEAIKEFHR